MRGAQKALTPAQQERADYIESLKSPAGGWTRETLALIGVTWPPMRGWLTTYILTGEGTAMALEEHYENELTAALKNVYAIPRPKVRQAILERHLDKVAAVLGYEVKRMPHTVEKEKTSQPGEGLGGKE